jgi:hypothetical protein
MPNSLNKQNKGGLVGSGSKLRDEPELAESDPQFG